MMLTRPGARATWEGETPYCLVNAVFSVVYNSLCVLIINLFLMRWMVFWWTGSVCLRLKPSSLSTLVNSVQQINRGQGTVFSSLKHEISPVYGRAWRRRQLF